MVVRAWLWSENVSFKNWGSWRDLNSQPRRSKRRALPFELQEHNANLEHRTGFEPVSQRWQRRVLNQTGPTMRLVGEDRIELSPRVPRTRMLALHHTPNEEEKETVVV